MDRTIIPGAVEGEVDPPSSKSYAQRAIAAALLADGTSVLSGIEMCDDTAAALRVVQALGAKVENPGPGTCAITGGGPDPKSYTLDIGESGLSTRLFTPIAALSHAPITIAGHGTILTRPMEMMLDPLRELGVEVADNKGRLPITVRGPMRGGEVEIDGSVSSQFLTGLLVALPLATSDTTVRVRNLRSIPYIDMTIDMMDRFGVDVDHRDYEEFYIPGSQTYTPAALTIEGDWSAASCLLVAGATASRAGVTVRNLNPVSLQADVAIVEALSRAGARIEQTGNTITVSHRELRAFTFDATDCPDLFPALAALAASCEGTSTIIGTSRLTHKESNRAEAIRSEYGKTGIEVDLSEPDTMCITGGPIGGGVKVDSHGDHRMAMSLAVTGLNASRPVTILGAGCVSKSYSDFWTDFDRLRIVNRAN
ncbi:MAG: 3-phosphoshikimate 1-carboxyvinyltransferase [Alistipes sp.]|jgi:3-phosphoshikimate 1-carboxyvinyltransferase|nr:3-phosphoshikimate 1-carboxyvinyltransferase [Alistipes sp.]